jgi:hypothetical protein
MQQKFEKIINQNLSQFFFIKYQQRHISSAHGRFPKALGIEFYCTKGDCKMGFSRHGHLREHNRIHNNLLDHCFFCPWTGVNQYNFMLHLNTHMRYRAYQCTFCKDKFYGAQALFKHEEGLHQIDSDKYTCSHETCDFKTHSISSMNYHARKHR